MSFATNASAFGIKPPAAPATNAFGQPKPGGLFGSQTAPTTTFGQPGNAFGQPQQNQAAGGAFGQPQQSGATGGLFGQPQQNQPAAGASLFGQPQQQPAATGGLFGQPQQNQQPATGGLFGQSQPAATGGLFGQSQTQQQPAATGGLFGQAQTQQPAAGGLFGAQNQTQPASGGLFGQTQTQPGTGGLFGQTQTQQQQPAAGGLFGASQQPAASGSGGLFGGSSTFNAPKPAGSGIFGAPTNTNSLLGSTNNAASSMFSMKPPQQQPLGLQTSQAASPFTKSTKFNDLPDNVKKTFEEIESHIQARIQISKDLHQRKLGDEPTKGQETIRAVYQDFLKTKTALRNDLDFMRDLKAKTDQTVQDTIIAGRLIDGHKTPHANAAYLKDHAGFPLEFFTRVTTQMRARLAWYKSTIEQIERKLSSSAGQAQHTPQSIHATLQAQNATFLALAAKTAALEAQLQKIKLVYTQLWRAKTGSHRDPFEGAEPVEGQDLGFSSLRM